MEAKQPISNKQKNQKKNKNNIIVIVCAAAILLGLIGTTSYFAYKSFNPTIQNNGKIIIDPTIEGSSVSDIKTTQEGNKTAMLSSDKYEIDDVKVCIGGTLLTINDEYKYTFSNSNNKALVTIYKTALDKHKGVITITPKYKSKDPEPTPEKELESISASFKETKSYKVGDLINRSDIKVFANYLDKSSKEITDWTSKLFNDQESYTFNKDGEQEIDISYNNKSTSLKVNVLDTKDYLLSISGLNEVYYKDQSLLNDTPNLIAYRVKSDGSKTKLDKKDLSIDVTTFTKTGIQNVKVTDNITKSEALLIVNVLEDNQVNKSIFENEMKNFASLYDNSQIEIKSFEDGIQKGEIKYYKQYKNKEIYNKVNSSNKNKSLIETNGYRYVFDSFFSSQPSFMNDFISSNSIYNECFVAYELNNLTNFDIYSFNDGKYIGSYIDSENNNFRYEIEFNKGLINNIKKTNLTKGDSYYTTYTYSYSILTEELFNTPSVYKKFNYMDVNSNKLAKNLYQLEMVFYKDLEKKITIDDPGCIDYILFDPGSTGAVVSKNGKTATVDISSALPIVDINCYILDKSCTVTLNKES